jgi:diacylglycerol O-acyltransferase
MMEVSALWVGVFSGLGSAVVVYLFAIRRMTSNHRIKRSMSFSSSVMVSGGFPVEAQVAPPIINILFLLGKCPTVESLARSIQRLLHYDRFRSTVHHNHKDGWHFKEVENFDVKTIIKSKDVANEMELHLEVDRISKLPMDDMEKVPAWAIHLIHNTTGGVSGMVVRIHHVIGDGISLVSTMERMFDEFIDTSDSNTKKEGTASKVKQVSSPNILNFIGQFFSAVAAAFHILALPGSSYDSDIKFTSPNKQTLKMTSDRSLILFPCLHLDFIKLIKNAAGVTVNDVMMAITTGAIRRYCEEVGDPVLKDKVLTRALVPVAFPRPVKESHDPVKALRNNWAFITCQLPVGVTTSKARLGECSRAMQSIKYSSAAAVQMWIQTNVLPIMPQFLQRKTAYDIFSRHSMVFSNVPGPPAPIHVCKEKVLGIQVIFPNLLTQCLIVSYAGEVFNNMVLDGQLLPNANTLLPKFYVDEALALAKAFDIEVPIDAVLSAKSPQGAFGIISV